MTRPAPATWHLPGLADEVAAAVAELESGLRLERIGHRACGVALWPTVQRSG